MDLNRNQHTNFVGNQDNGGIIDYLQLIAEVLLLWLKIILSICESTFRLIVPVSEKSVKGEVVLITGAGHGIGKELAFQYACSDAIVVCWDINDQATKNIVSLLKKKGKTAYGYTCDVTKRNQVIETVEKVKREVGDITILINNAGILLSRPLLEHDQQDLKRTIDVNVMSHFWTIQTILPSMIKNNHGHIVALSSYVGLSGHHNLVPYSASKFAVRGLMSALRDELRFNSENKIKLTTIFPYIVDTGLCKNYSIRFPRAFKEISPRVAAECIITAQRRDIVEETIPKMSLTFHNILKTFPFKVENLLRDFVNIHFESDK